MSALVPIEGVPGRRWMCVARGELEERRVDLAFSKKPASSRRSEAAPANEPLRATGQAVHPPGLHADDGGALHQATRGLWGVPLGVFFVLVGGVWFFFLGGGRCDADQGAISASEGRVKGCPPLEG